MTVALAFATGEGADTVMPVDEAPRDHAGLFKRAEDPQQTGFGYPGGEMDVVQ